MKRWTSHGMSNSREYASWKGMLQRCENVRHRQYPEWGGRGITVAPVWHDFTHFYRDMGPRPEGTTLERINNNAGYAPGNCRWATTAEQQRNTRYNVWVELQGVRLCLKDWSRRLDINYVTVCMRIKRGMTPIEALTTPVRWHR